MCLKHKFFQQHLGTSSWGTLSIFHLLARSMWLNKSLGCMLFLFHPKMCIRDMFDRILSQVGTRFCRMTLRCTPFRFHPHASRHHIAYICRQSLSTIVPHRCQWRIPTNCLLGRNTSHRSSTFPECPVLGYQRMSLPHTLSPRHQHMSKAHTVYKHQLVHHKS